MENVIKIFNGEKQQSIFSENEMENRLLKLRDNMQNENIEALKKGEVNFISNAIYFESLISRGRNAAAASALHHNSDYLMFIDADVVFQPEDVFKLISHDKDVVCGVYPKKFVNDKKVDFLFSNCDKSIVENGNWRQICTDASSEIRELAVSQYKTGEKLLEVDYAATGFMLIKTAALKKIIKAKPGIKYRNDIDGYMEYGDNFYDFFPARINQSTKKYESEEVYELIHIASCFPELREKGKTIN